MNVENLSYIATKPRVTTTGFSSVNPATSEPLPGTFANNTPEDVNEAAIKAKEAFTSYSQLSDKKRAIFLETIANQLEQNKEAIINRCTAETGLPELRIQGELGRTCSQLRLFSNLLKEGSWVRAVIDTAEPERQPLPKPDVRLTVLPLGPIAVFGASNFPLAFSTAGGDTASALAAGCPVIVKAHSSHPGTSIIVAEAINAAIIECDIAPGVFSIISSNATHIGVDLVKHPDVKAVGFTGSLGGGRALYDICCSRPEPIPFFGELGSTNPVFLLENALKEDMDTLVQGFAASLTMGSGQFCTSPGLLIAQKGELLDKFVEKASILVSLSEPQVMLSESISSTYAKDSDQRTSVSGVEILAKGKTPTLNQGSPILAKVSAQDFLANPDLEHEVFGAFSLLIECDNEQQILDVARSFGGHLTATLHTQNDKQAKQIAYELAFKVGRVIFNNWPTGVEVCHAMQHGGPYPAATFGNTSVGARAIDRWVRPVAFQNMPDALLPYALKNSNPLNIHRVVNNKVVSSAI